MGEVWISVMMGILHGVTFIYDAVTYIPQRLVFKPKKRLQKSQRVKAVPIDDSKTTYRSIDSIEKLTTTPIRDCETLDDLFVRAVRLFADTDCVGTRELLSEEDEKQANGKVFKKVIMGDYNWLTYKEVNRKMSHLGSGLLALGQKPRCNILLFAETRAEWMISLQACLKYNYPVVTLYATLGDEAVVHAVNETEAEYIITSAQLLPKFKTLLSRMPHVKKLVYMEDYKRLVAGEYPANVEIYSFTQVQEIGKKPENVQTPVTKPTREDIAVIMYTSGSTGIPKGVLISHGNLMCGTSGQCERVTDLGPQDTYIGYLPLAHVLELAAELSCLSHGTRIGYSSPQTLSDQSSRIKRGSKGDATVLKPTLMAAVPVIMDRMYKAVWEKVDEGGKVSRALFTFAYNYKKKNILKGYDTPIFNKIVFKKVRALLGGRLRLMLSGGAPLSADTQQFMNVCFCCPVGQGYGLTETCGAGTVHETTDLSTGRVGAPLQCSDVKLVDWLEGGYKVTDTPYPRGEILIGGGNVAQGYYKNPEKTAQDFKTMDGQRWFCTGDIAEFHEDGCVRIIDRKKDLVKLSAGEYVSLGKVETALKMSQLVDNVCVFADSLQDYTVALVSPSQKAFMALAKKMELSDLSWEELCENKTMEQEVLKSVQDQAKKSKLERFEVPKKVTLCHEMWTPDTELVTEALKLRRRNIEQHYQTDISRMYA